MNKKAASRCAWLILAMTFFGSLVRAQDVTIVVNSSLSISEITETQLRDIFIGAQAQFDNGTRAVPVLLKGGPVHEVFLHRHIGDTPDEFRTRWRRAVFTGQGSMPREFNSETEVLQYIEATPGAIGYLSRKPDRDRLKVLMIVAARRRS
ncbi:MAG TPA: hypothetical protein VMG82_12255 [Candidatus Sulfotelmatobacter sp.]|nr:hypothetical protein [Candidatus Sulfotelmatobacter sp.]